MRALLAAMLLSSCVCMAEPLKIVVPFGSGMQVDNLARVVAEELRKAGEPTVVENMPGASSIIGTRAVINAKGRTLLLTVALLVQVPHLYKVPPFDPLHDLKPVVLGVRSATALVVSNASSLPADLKGILAAARSSQVNYASYGTGSTAHLNGALLEKLAGVPLVHVPYNGAGDVNRDLYAGRVQLSFEGPGTAIESAKAGKVRIVAVAAEERLKALPSTPTIRELGYPVGITGWQGFLAPASMPDAEVARLNALLVAALTQPYVIALQERWGAEVAAGTPEAFAQLLRAQYTAWRDVIAGVGLLGSL